MLVHGLQGMNGRSLHVPRSRELEPRREFLEARYEVFRREGVGRRCSRVVPSSYSPFAVQLQSWTRVAQRAQQPAQAGPSVRRWLCLYTMARDEEASVSPVEQLEAAALSLPRSERARLAERLLASLDEDPDVDAAWREEVRRRIEQYRAGEIKSVPADEVFEEARKRLER